MQNHFLSTAIFQFLLLVHVLRSSLYLSAVSVSSSTFLHNPWPLYSTRTSMSSVTPSVTLSTCESMARTRALVSSLPRLWLLMNNWWHLRLVSRVWREWEQDRDIISIRRGILITSLRDNVWQPQCSEKTQFCKYRVVLSPVSHYTFLRGSVNDCRGKKSLSLDVSDLYKDFP